MFGEYETVHLDYLPHENSTFFLRKSIVWFWDPLKEIPTWVDEALTVKQEVVHKSHITVGELIEFFSAFLGILSQPGRPPLSPPPPPQKLEFPKRKKKINVYFAFQTILSILFFHQNCHFFGWDDKRGVQYPHELIRYWLPIFIYFITFLAIYQGKLSFGQSW